VRSLLPRSRFAPAAVALLAILLVGGACAPAGGVPTAAPDDSIGPVATAGGPGCDTGNLPGWPRPGQVTTSGIIPVLPSSERLVGESRLLFVLVDEQNRPIADETLEVEMGFFDLCTDPAAATEVLTPSFEWGVVGQRAFYVATPELSHAGTWGAAVTVRDPATGTTSGAKLQFTVAEDGFGPRIGDTAPAVRTPTLADVDGDVRQISTDPQPEPAFYRLSLDEALAAGEPFLLAFITPAFCRSAQCGPTIDVVKRAVEEAPIRVVAVEPYELVYEDGRLKPVYENGGFVPVEAGTTYGIPTEPLMFVVDGSGTISASFEAVVADDELVEAIRAVTQ
jgi:hypothetical protein